MDGHKGQRWRIRHAREASFHGDDREGSVKRVDEILCAVVAPDSMWGIVNPARGWECHVQSSASCAIPAIGSPGRWRAVV